MLIASLCCGGAGAFLILLVMGFATMMDPSLDPDAARSLYWSNVTGSSEFWVGILLGAAGIGIFVSRCLLGRTRRRK